MTDIKYSIICAVNKPKVFEENLLLSPGINKHDLIIQHGYNNVCKAYNDAIDCAINDILIFVHQDVYFPKMFFEVLDKSIAKLFNENWGIIGPAGRNRNGEFKGNILDRGNMWGNSFNLPVPVQTLDELCLIVKKGTFKYIRFDQEIKNQHLFGSDICLQAEAKGFLNFAIRAFCNHNSSQDYTLPNDFEETASYLKLKWHDRLPIYSTCQIII